MGRALRLLLLGLVLVGVQAHAAERSYYFERIDSNEGLAQNTVNLIVQDKNGYMWLATQGGLHRYDGYQLKHYRHDPSRTDSLPANMVAALTDADHGNLWLSTISGDLTLFNPRTDRTVPLPGALNQQLPYVTALSEGAGHTLTIGTVHGIFMLDANQRDLQTLWTPSSPNVPVRAFTTCPDGTRYALTPTQILVVGDSAKTTRALARGLQGTRSVKCIADGRLLLAGHSGVLVVDRHRGNTQPLWPAHADATLPSTNVRAITQDHKGRLWLAVRNVGLVGIDTHDRAQRILRPKQDMPGGLPDAQISTLYVDRSGLLWAGTVRHGAVYTDPDGSPFHYFMVTDPGADNNVEALLQASDGTLWVGYGDAGLRSYNPASGRFTDYAAAFAKVLDPQANPRLRVYRIVADGSGYRLATSHGLLHFDPVQQQVRRLYPELTYGRGSTVRTVLHARDGSWWLAINGYGLAHVRNGKLLSRYSADAHAAKQLPSDMILKIVQDTAGNIWAGTADGLARIAPDGSIRSFHEVPGHSDSLAGRVITSLYVDDRGGVWAGTQSGLNQLLDVDAHGAHFRRYLARDGLPDTTIYCIQGDASQRLWLSTNLGVTRLDPATGQIRVFSRRDGLQGLEYNAGACARGNDGSLLFGGVNGFDRVQPASITPSSFSPPVVITDVAVGIEKPHSPATVNGDLHMSRSDRVVRLDFAAMDFAAPQLNRFQYRLRGFDRDWIDAGTRHSATYTNLDSGSYLFEVRGSNHQGHFGSAITRLRLRVAPLWWESFWARVAYVLLALLIVLAGVMMWRARRASARLHERQLRVREDRLSMALWGSGDAFWDLDLRTNRLYRPGADAMLGAGSLREINLDDWRNHIMHPDDMARVQDAADAHLAGRSDYIEEEFRVRNSDGGWTWLLARGKVAERDDAGHPLRICGTARDIGERRHAESDRRIAAEVIRCMTEAVAVTDLDFNFRSVNPAFTRMTGYGEDDIHGVNAATLNSRDHDPGTHSRLREQVATHGHWRGELWQRRKDGSEFLSWVEVNEVHDSAGVRTHHVAVLTDITDRKRAEQELRYLANYDTLTGLPNRTLLSARLGDAIAAARRNNTQLAVLYVDLDRFKHINDSMGHATGDHLLKAAGARLRQCVRDHDTVARVGGDEFTLVVEDVDSAEDAEATADRIIRAFTSPLLLETRQEVLISPSVGIALHPQHGRNADELLKYADTAMYQAKERGRNIWTLYTEDMDTSARLRADMSSALRRALERDELDVVYQPKLDIVADRIIGVEALLRWHSADLGTVPPDIFIPLAEESGLIVELGEFVLRRACSELARWRENGLENLSMAVNLSMAQLQRSELPLVLRGILSASALPANCLELELTESTVMSNVEQSVHTLGELKAIGVTLAIDDFGTGYSSLAYLKRLPIDTLKIDRDFVRDVTLDPEDATITSTIISMAHLLGLDVVAEGVETAEQLTFLRRHGCDGIQGNLFSLPLQGSECMHFCVMRGVTPQILE